MELIHISNSDELITPNFKMSEFWRPKFGGGFDFDIPQCLIYAAQIMRDFWGATAITSCKRPNDTFGFHRYLNGTGAIDLIPLNESLNNLAKFKKECLNYQNSNGSELINSLRNAGIQGAGIESKCCHLDFRNDESCSDTDRYGKYCIFEWQPDLQPNGTSKVYHKINN